MAQMCKGLCTLEPYKSTNRSFYNRSLKDREFYFACSKCGKRLRIDEDDPNVEQYPPIFCPCCGCTLRNFKPKKQRQTRFKPKREKNLVVNFNKPGKLHQVIKLKGDDGQMVEIVKVVDFQSFFKVGDGDQ